MQCIILPYDGICQELLWFTLIKNIRKSWDKNHKSISYTNLLWGPMVRPPPPYYNKGMLNNTASTFTWDLRFAYCFLLLSNSWGHIMQVLDGGKKQGWFMDDVGSGWGGLVLLSWQHQDNDSSPWTRRLVAMDDYSSSAASIMYYHSLYLTLTCGWTVTSCRA